jgi:hypothetical protein
MIARLKAAASLALSFDDAMAHASSILCHLLKRHALTARRLAKVRALLEDEERSSVVFWQEVPHRHRCRPRPNLHTKMCIIGAWRNIKVHALSSVCLGLPVATVWRKQHRTARMTHCVPLLSLGLAHYAIATVTLALPDALRFVIWEVPLSQARQLTGMIQAQDVGAKIPYRHNAD